MISEGQLVIKDRSHAFIAPGADDCVTFNRASRRSGGVLSLEEKKDNSNLSLVETKKQNKEKIVNTKALMTVIF